MRFSLLTASFIAAIVPSLAQAQGILVPRPCPPGGCAPGAAAIVHVSSSAQVQLRNGVLEFVITDVLRNPGSVNGEVDYVFPLPKMAAFQNLAMSIDGEMMAGEVLPADRARTIYESIVRANRDPALVEWMGHGMLRTRIFPIMPGEEKRVEVRLQSVAQREGGALRVDYNVGSRRGQAVGAGGTTTSLTFTYPDSARYGTPYSPTHTVTESAATPPRSRTRSVTLTGNSSELALLLPVRTSTEASITLLSHAPRNNVREAGFALITLTPPTITPRTTPRDVVFVLDISGSMAGAKMVQAREAGKQLLATLRAGDRFRMIHFATDVSFFEPGFVNVTPQNIRRAGEYLDALEATGSTNIMAALQEGLRSFEQQSGDRLPLMLFVTDGAPTVGEINVDNISRRAAELRGRARIFSFGVGADVKAELIEQLAVEGRGTAHLVSVNESVEHAVSLVASRLTAPLITDLRFTSTGATFDRMHPSDVSDVFEGQDLVLLARFNGSGTATLNFEGRTADGPVRWTSTVTLPERELGNTFVSRLWATQRVGFLSAERRRNGANPELDAEIRSLGETYSIPTLFTSYLVLEPGVQIGADGRAILDRAANRGTAAGTGIGAGGGGAAAAGSVARGGGGGGGGRGGGGASQQGQQGQGGQRATFTVQGGVAARASAPGTAADASALQALAGKVSGVTLHEAVMLDERLRNARSESELAAALGNANVKRVGDRLFALIDSTFVDIRHKDTVNVTKIKPYSEGYFTLLKAIPSLGPIFALGDKVIAVGKGMTIHVDNSGVERLTAEQLARITREW